MDAPQKSNTNADDNRVVVRVSCFGCARCARRVCACVRVHRMLLALTGCFQCCARCVCAHLQNVCTRRNSVQHATDKHDNDRVRCASTEKTFSVAECVDEKEISSHRTHREKIFSPHTRKKFWCACVHTEKWQLCTPEIWQLLTVFAPGKIGDFLHGENGRKSAILGPGGYSN